MAKYTVVAKDECISCAACVAAAPDIFEFGEDDLSQNFFDNDKNTGTVVIPDYLEADLDAAAEGCPTGAIKVQEQPFQ